MMDTIAVRRGTSHDTIVDINMCILLISSRLRCSGLYFGGLRCGKQHGCSLRGGDLSCGRLCFSGVDANSAAVDCTVV